MGLPATLCIWALVRVLCLAWWLDANKARKCWTETSHRASLLLTHVDERAHTHNTPPITIWLSKLLVSEEKGGGMSSRYLFNI